MFIADLGLLTPCTTYSLLLVITHCCYFTWASTTLFKNSSRHVMKVYRGLRAAVRSSGAQVFSSILLLKKKGLLKDRLDPAEQYVAVELVS